jgi:hypothetical protein
MVYMRFNPDDNDKYYKKINIDTIEIDIRIYFGLRTNLLIMISITRNQRAGFRGCSAGKSWHISACLGLFHSTSRTPSYFIPDLLTN